MKLNLYAGIGGNRLPWTGNDITAVEIDERIANIYKQRFPSDNVVIGDAYLYLEDHFHEFDFIWASPRCQSHSKMSRIHVGRRYKGWNMKVQIPDMKLYGIIVFLRDHFRGDWIVENVKSFYEPLIKQTAVVGRHYIWSNKPIQDKKIDTEGIMFKYKNDKKHYENYLIEMCKIYKVDRNLMGEIPHNWGYNYDGQGQILRNTIHPDIARYLWNQVNKKKKTPRISDFMC